MQDRPNGGLVEMYPVVDRSQHNQQGNQLQCVMVGSSYLLQELHSSVELYKVKAGKRVYMLALS